MTSQTAPGQFTGHAAAFLTARPTAEVRAKLAAELARVNADAIAANLPAARALRLLDQAATLREAAETTEAWVDYDGAGSTEFDAFVAGNLEEAAKLEAAALELSA